MLGSPSRDGSDFLLYTSTPRAGDDVDHILISMRLTTDHPACHQNG